MKFTFLTTLILCSLSVFAQRGNLTTEPIINGNPTDVLWGEGAKITVCWTNPDGPSTERRQWVREAVEGSWSTIANVDFVGWGACADMRLPANSFRIKIEDIATDGPRVTELGRNMAGTTRPTMYLNLSLNNWGTTGWKNKIGLENSIKAIAIHEFGHALGFTHEMNRSDCGCVDANDTPITQGTTGNQFVTPCDKESIMTYCPESLDIMLSDWDIKGARQLYGTRGPEVSGKRRWRVSRGGKTAWVPWSTANASISNHLYGDFNGDGEGDILITTGAGFDLYYGGRKYKKGAFSKVAAKNCRVGDFNGDGKDDVLHYHAGAYHYSNGGTGGWTKLFGTIITMEFAKVGDFNGDGKDDVFAAWNGFFRYMDLKTKKWVILLKSPIKAQDLAIVRFSNDKVSDITTVFGGRVQVLYNGQGPWKQKTGTNIPFSRLAFADINGDGITDLLTAFGNRLKVAHSASGSWQNYVGTSFDITNLRFADLDGKKGVEIITLY